MVLSVTLPAEILLATHLVHLANESVAQLKSCCNQQCGIRL